jgi:hypothetical protein
VVLTCIVLCGTQGGNLAQLFHEWKTRHHPVILASIVVAAVVNPDSDGYVWIKQDNFRESFCQDLPADEAR